MLQTIYRLIRRRFAVYQRQESSALSNGRRRNLIERKNIHQAKGNELIDRIAALLSEAEDRLSKHLDAALLASSAWRNFQLFHDV
jgi:hypothetical protein